MNWLARAGCALALLLLTACANRPPAVQPARLSGASMGTTWSASLAPGYANAHVRALIEDELARLTALLSAWEPDSALSRLNHGSGDWQALPAELTQVLGHALELARTTGGAYDPSIAPLVALWGFGPDGARRSEPPSAADIAAARSRVDWRRVELDAARSRARLPPGMQIDVNSLGPGFALDCIAARLRAHGIDDFLLELGGELLASGRRPDGGDWHVAVEHPQQPIGAYDLVLRLRAAALGSSGGYHSGFIHAGRRYAHTLDPRSGEPVQHALAAVTVLAAHAIEADALAAALLVLGPDAGWDYARAHGVAAVFTLRTGDGGYRRRLTPQMRAHVAA